MKQLSEALETMLSSAQSQELSLPMQLHGSIKKDGKLTILLKSSIREEPLQIEKATSMMSWLPQLGSRLERLAPNSVMGRTFFIESDYIYRPKKNPTEKEINAVLELGRFPSLKSVVMNLAHLMAFRPILNASSNQSELVINDIARRIIKEGFSETGVIWGIDKLSGGTTEFGGRNFPTRDEIIGEIRNQDKKVKMIIKGFEGECGDIPKDFHIDSSVDWILDNMDAS